MKTWITFTALITLLGMVSIECNAETLKLSGILGQSQPAGTQAYPNVSASGLFLDKSGKLWTADGDTLFGFNKNKTKWKISDTIKLPSSVSLGVCSDNEYLYVACWDGKVHEVDTIKKTVTDAFPYPEKARAFTVAPSGLSKGFAANARYFTLEGTAVSAFTKDGKPLGQVLQLPLPKDAQWWYCSLGIEPNSGDLLVGSYYSDSTVYRWRTDGQQVTVNGWPQKGVHASGIINIGNTAWALVGGGARSLPDIQHTAADVKTVDAAYSYYNNGLVEDKKSGYLMSSSQGIILYDKDGKPLHQRIGGLSGIHNMAVLANGILLGSVENGGRFVRMYISDEPDTAFISNANEPWRTAANWSSTESGIAADGDSFIILDSTLKQLWNYDPSRTDGQFWSKLTEPNSFNSPKAISSSNAHIWVLDNNSLLEISRKSPSSQKEINLPDINPSETISITSPSDTQLITADKNSVESFTRKDSGEYADQWTSETRFTQISSLASTEKYIYILDKSTNTVSALSAETGKLLAAYNGKDLPNGFQPTSITAISKWLLISEEYGKQILRLKITQ